MKHGPPLAHPRSHAHDNLKILFSKTIIGLSEPNLTGTFIGWASAKQRTKKYFLKQHLKVGLVHIHTQKEPRTEI
jgi:hypothetical protein